MQSTATASPKFATRVEASTLWRRLSKSAWTVAALIFLVYGWWLLVFFRSGHDARDFALVEQRYAQQSHVSSAISFGPHFHYAKNGGGYDGQFIYFIALDPINARYYVDGASYRYTKILYPLMARFLALGRSDLIPYTLILINWLAMAGGTLALAAWLKRKKISPWLALIYGMYPGLFFAFQRDLTEPLSYALIALAVYLFDYGGKRRVLWSGVAFGLAVMARDKSAVFATIFGLSLLFVFQRDVDSVSVGNGGWKRIQRAALLLALAGVPMLLYKVFLHYWLGSLGMPQEQAAPLQGVISSGISLGDRLVETIGVFVPALICLVLCAWALWKRMWAAPVFLLLVSIDLAVVTLHPAYFVDPFGMLRVGTAIMLAALYCIPVFDRLTGGKRTWLVASGACWLWLSVVWLVMGSMLLAG